MTIKRRIQDLEAHVGTEGDGPGVVVQGVGGDEVIVDGETMTRAELAARWPDREPRLTVTIGGLDPVKDL